MPARTLRPALLASFALTALLAACGGTTPAPGAGTPPPDKGTPGTGGGGKTYNKVGYISFMQVAGPDQAFVFGLAGFGTSSAQSQPSSGGLYGSLKGTCQVYAGDQEGPADPTPDTSTSLDAGDPLTVTASGSTYATLTRQISNNVIGYTTDIQHPLAALPNSALTVNVPGAAGGVQQMSVTLPTAPTFALTQPQDHQVTADTSFAWSNATNDASNVVLISGSNNDPDPSKETVFSCVAPDTGSFVFPSATKQALAAKNFSGQVTQAGRVAGGVSVQGDVLVFTNVARLTAYDAPVALR